MKIYGLNGKMQGKLGNSVMAVNHGVQIARQYNPIVKDAKSAAQTAVRAKFKLLTQLGAIMAPAIVMKRDGLVSPRNKFAQKNYSLVTFNEGLAEVNLANVQITDGYVNHGALSVGRSGDVINMRWIEEIYGVSATMYVIFQELNDKLVYLQTRVTTNPATGNHYGVSINNTNNKLVVYAYTFTTISTLASQVFGNIETLTAEDVAKLLVTSSMTSEDVAISATSGYILQATA